MRVVSPSTCVIKIQSERHINMYCTRKEREQSSLLTYRIQFVIKLLLSNARWVPLNGTKVNLPLHHSPSLVFTYFTALYPFIFKIRCSTNSLNAALNEPCSHNKRFYTRKRFQNGRYFRETRKCRTPRRFISTQAASEYFFTLEWLRILLKQ